MTSRRRLPIHHRDVGVRLGRQRVRERKPAGAPAYNQIIGFHEHALAPRAASQITRTGL
jgi:hypothetical protein